MWDIAAICPQDAALQRHVGPVEGPQDSVQTPGLRVSPGKPRWVNTEPVQLEQKVAPPLGPPARRARLRSLWALGLQGDLTALSVWGWAASPLPTQPSPPAELLATVPFQGTPGAPSYHSCPGREGQRERVPGCSAPPLLLRLSPRAVFSSVTRGRKGPG